MELKWRKARIDKLPDNVQIVPLWNWNTFAVNMLRCERSFKLYLYGIEIVACIIVKSKVLSFKLYLYGIEMQQYQNI